MTVGVFLCVLERVESMNSLAGWTTVIFLKLYPNDILDINSERSLLLKVFYLFARIFYWKAILLPRADF